MSTARSVLTRAAGDQPIAVGAGERREPEAKLVGAVTAQLALVSVLELLATGAALTGLLDPLLQLFVLLLLPRGERLGRGIDHPEQLVDDRSDGRAVTVELPRDVVPRLTARREPTVAREQPSAVEVASRCRGSEPCRRLLDSFGDERRSPRAQPEPARSRCGRSATRS